LTGPHSKDDVINSRYQILGYIGAGGMQYVYKAFDSTTNREVAIKTPKDHTVEKGFHSSAVISAKVNHPNVAKTLDYFESKKKYYLVEELIEGQDLSKAILDKVDYLDPFLVSRILHHLAKGLAASHHAKVIHRDLKPTNIMVSGGFCLNEIKITDFGIAKMADEVIADAVEHGEATMSQSETVRGAIPYMAPEAINTPKNVGEKADVWSIGAIAFELLSGKKPFGSGLRAVERILHAKLEKYPAFVTSNSQFSHLSEELIEIIGKCLQLDANARPTADELVRLCSQLCYPVSDRFIGIVKNRKYNYGFIETFGPDVQYHNFSVYGKKPVNGERVVFSKYEGTPRDRAHPVIKMS